MNDNGAGNDNDNTNDNVNDNGAGNDNDNTNDNVNDNGAGNDNDNVNDNGTPPGNGGNGNDNGADDCPPQPFAAKSSGAAQPGETVTLTLDVRTLDDPCCAEDPDCLPQDCREAAMWTQDASDPFQVNFLTPAVNEGEEVTFLAPDVDGTRFLTFTVTIPDTCSVGAREDTLEVPICGPHPFAAKSSGAAQPGETVTLTLDVRALDDPCCAEDPDCLPQDCREAATWELGTCMADVDGDGTDEPVPCPVVEPAPTRDENDVLDGGAAFPAPNITTTTSLNFTVTVPQTCSVGARTGSLSVSIQVASVDFDMPDTVVVDGSVNLTDATTVTGAPANRLHLYFPQEFLPPGVEINITQESVDLLTGDPIPAQLEVIAGADQTIEVTLQVVGLAGVLAEVRDTILIVAPD